MTGEFICLVWIIPPRYIGQPPPTAMTNGNGMVGMMPVSFPASLGVLYTTDLTLLRPWLASDIDPLILCGLLPSTYHSTCFGFAVIEFSCLSLRERPWKSIVRYIPITREEVIENGVSRLVDNDVKDVAGMRAQVGVLTSVYMQIYSGCS